MARRPVVQARRLSVHYRLPSRWPLGAGRTVHAVDQLDLNLFEGETLGIVGESGCGKSTLARALCGLVPVTRGSIEIAHQDVTHHSPAQWRPLRRTVQFVFQDPLASLDPRMTIGQAIAEPMEALCPEWEASVRERRVAELLDRVGLSVRLRNRYPHEFSGGQCQRVGIARALSVEPKILICDEPVSALDVSVQAQIINLLKDLQREAQLSMLFIAHDLSVVRHVSDRVMVMYLGRVMEQGDTDALFATPRHPYTRALLAAIPRPDRSLPSDDERLQGEMPSATIRPTGCAFVGRCPIAEGVCTHKPPPVYRDASGAVACHFIGGSGAEHATVFRRTAPV